MNINIPTLILAVVASTIIMVAFPDKARDAVQKWTPWGDPAATEQAEAN